MTKGPDHENSVAALLAALMRILPEGWHVRSGSPVRIPEDSEPEPDLMVLQGTIRNFQGRHASAGEVGLLVEVADTSLRFDSGSKLEVYAEAGVPVYWVVNLPRRRIDVYSRPSGPGTSPSYADQESHAPGQSVPVVLDGREVGQIAVDDVLF
jgi:Uma2 family endonuclease